MYSEQVKEQSKAAAAYMREHGFFKGEYFGPNDSCCALGAIRKGTGLHDDECELAQAFAAEIGEECADINEWNDAVERTQEEVLAVFDRIANS